MTRTFSVAVVAGLSTLALALPRTAHAAESGLARVWAVTDTEKVRADDLAHWAASSPDNTVWDGQSVHLFAGRNETVAFQLILESGGNGASGVNVELASLTDGSHVIQNTGSGDPFDFVGRRIELFTEHYIHITDRSSFGGSWGWVAPQPDSDFLGWVPDGLIPFEAPPGPHDHGIGGAPFAIEPSRNQGVWVDVFVPKQQPAGDYSGSLKVSEGGSVTREVPVILHVYDFTLPDETHFHNMFFLGHSLLERHGAKDESPEYWALLHKYMNLAHRHRLDLTDGDRTLDVFGPNLGGYYTGEYYDAAHGYEGPGAGVGNRTYSIGTYDQPDGGWRSGFYPATEQAWQAAADAWESWFSQNAPEVVRFKYMTDEPQPSAYDTVSERAGWIHSSTGPGKNLKTYCTVRIDPALYGAIDFWALTVQSGYDDGSGITAGYDLPKVKERQALGELAAIYNGTRPSYGQVSALDAPAADNRINPWIAWKYGVDQYFLWETGGFTYYPHNPWDDQYIADGSAKAWGNGDYIYPGTDVELPGDSRGIDGPIASVRMKNWRRGQQDYEYLWLAKQLGIDTSEIVSEVVPAAFDDYDATFTSQSDQPEWAERGHVFEHARQKLAELLDGKAGASGVGTGGTGGNGGSPGNGGTGSGVGGAGHAAGASAAVPSTTNDGAQGSCACSAPARSPRSPSFVLLLVAAMLGGAARRKRQAIGSGALLLLGLFGCSGPSDDATKHAAGGGAGGHAGTGAGGAGGAGAAAGAAGVSSSGGAPSGGAAGAGGGNAGAAGAAPASGPIKGLVIGGYLGGGEIEDVKRLIPALPAQGANTLVLRVDYNFEYDSHPEVRDGGWFTKAQAHELAALAKQNGIRLVPMVNLFGHQSYEDNGYADVYGLLRSHPDFDETPEIPVGQAGYARSLCPNANGVKPIVADLIDEVVDAFEADSFHLGLDEVLLIGHDQRCIDTGKSNAKIYAEWLGFLHDHLRSRGVSTWIWGDRLIPASLGYDGYWESSGNDTWEEIDSIQHPEDIVVLDWHYGVESSYPSVSDLFSPKGFQSAPAVFHDLDATKAFVTATLDPTAPKYPGVRGVVQTHWGDATVFTSWLLDGAIPDGTSDSVAQYAKEDVASFQWSMGYFAPTP